jgi:sugar phosphate permease
MYTGGTRVCADWYPEHQRSMPIAVFNASASLGPAIAPALLTPLILIYGWRIAFIALGILGVLVAAAWAAFYRHPSQRALSPEDRAAIGATNTPPVLGSSRALLASLLRQPVVWALSAGFFGVIYLTWLYATWLPAYLQEQRHLTLAQAGPLTSIPLAAGFLGALLAGALIQFLIRRGWTPIDAARRPVIWSMLITAAATLAGALAHPLWLCLALLSLGVFTANLASSAGWALGAVLVPAEEVASLEAIQNVGGSIGGALAPALTGYVVQTTGSFTPAFALAAAIAVLTAAIYALAIKKHCI